MKQLCKNLTIFEGPDGSGKTTAAQEYAAATGARYVHFSAMPHVTKNLPRMYVEAMLPALLGYQDVVFDRSWLSDLPYGVAFREGQQRIDFVAMRMLERVAMRCSTMVVFCDPGFQTCLGNFNSRRHMEMLKSGDQLLSVYNGYQMIRHTTQLPYTNYDYVNHHGIAEYLIDGLSLQCRVGPHNVDLLSAGNINGRVLIVGDEFAERKDCDPLYQAPFVSFSNLGCSRWLTEQLMLQGVDELDLYWLNADQDFSMLENLNILGMIALGHRAERRLEGTTGFEIKSLPHPNFWKRFNSHLIYPIGSYIKEILS